jgi:hypothetical protein
MKNLTITIVLGLLLVHVGKISAQNDDELKHEVYAGYGMASLPRLVASTGAVTLDLLEIFSWLTQQRQRRPNLLSPKQLLPNVLIGQRSCRHSMSDSRVLPPSIMFYAFYFK